MKTKCKICNDTGRFTNPFDQEYKCDCTKPKRKSKMEKRTVANIFNDYKLCFVKNGSAYFTKNELSTQWGDDWNDIPYEHNAGEPYFDKDGDILEIHFYGWIKEPCNGYSNSPYSVECINKNGYWWLSGDLSNTKLYPGATPGELIEFVKANSGKIFLPLSLFHEMGLLKNEDRVNA